MIDPPAETIAALRERLEHERVTTYRVLELVERAAAALAAQEASLASLRTFVQAFADEACLCPTTYATGHGKCRQCRARAALASADARPPETGEPR